MYDDTEPEEFRKLDERGKLDLIRDLKKRIADFPPKYKLTRKQAEELIEYTMSLSLLLAEFPKFYDEALENLFKILDLAERFDLKNKLASIKGSIASVYYARGDFLRAARYYLDSLDILGNRKNSEVMIGKKGLGLSLIAMGKEEEGVNYLLQAADLCADLRDYNNYMDILILLKKHYLSKKAYDVAAEIEKKAVKILEKTRNYYEIAMGYFELGRYLGLSGDYEGACNAYKTGTNYAFKAKTTDLMYKGVVSVAETYYKLGKIEEAKKEYLKALSIAAYLGDENEILKTKTVLRLLGINESEINTAIKKGIDERKSRKI